MKANDKPCKERNGLDCVDRVSQKSHMVNRVTFLGLHEAFPRFRVLVLLK